MNNSESSTRDEKVISKAKFSTIRKILISTVFRNANKIRMIGETLNLETQGEIWWNSQS